MPFLAENPKAARCLSLPKIRKEVVIENEKMEQHRQNFTVGSTSFT